MGKTARDNELKLDNEFSSCSRRRRRRRKEESGITSRAREISRVSFSFETEKKKKFVNSTRLDAWLAKGIITNALERTHRDAMRARFLIESIFAWSKIERGTEIRFERIKRILCQTRRVYTYAFRDRARGVKRKERREKFIQRILRIYARQWKFNKSKLYIYNKVISIIRFFKMIIANNYSGEYIFS